VPFVSRTALHSFRALVGYKGMKGGSGDEWHAPREFLCPSDVVSIKERPDSQWDSWLSYGYNLTDWYFSDWFGIGYAGHRNTTVPSPSGELIFTESNDWWLWWWGANYEDGWDVLGHDTITPYKQVGTDGPTLYRHSEGVNIAFYDGHTEYMKKEKVFIKDACKTLTTFLRRALWLVPPPKSAIIISASERPTLLIPIIVINCRKNCTLYLLGGPEFRRKASCGLLSQEKGGSRAEVRRERKKRDILSPANVLLFSNKQYITKLYASLYFFINFFRKISRIFPHNFTNRPSSLSKAHQRPF